MVSVFTLFSMVVLFLFKRILTRERVMQFFSTYFCQHLTTSQFMQFHLKPQNGVVLQGTVICHGFISERWFLFSTRTIVPQESQHIQLCGVEKAGGNPSQHQGIAINTGFSLFALISPRKHCQLAPVCVCICLSSSFFDHLKLSAPCHACSKQRQITYILKLLLPMELISLTAEFHQNWIMTQLSYLPL